MSYVRWNEEGSNVYVIGTSSGYECVGCELSDSLTPDVERFVAHLDKHKEMGDAVPEWLAQKLRTHASSGDVMFTDK